MCQYACYALRAVELDSIIAIIWYKYNIILELTNKSDLVKISEECLLNEIFLNLLKYIFECFYFRL